MCVRRWILGIGLCLTLCTAGFAQTSDADRIDALVRKLGSSSYVQREQARKELESIGVPALDALRKAAKNADLDTARRLADLIRNFEEQLVARQILAPKEVHFKLKDATIQQAIAELANVSGYPIQFLGDAMPFADTKINLDRKMAFWQAFDWLCDQGGLMQRIDAPQPNQPMYQKFGKAGRMRMVPPPQPQQAGPIIITNRSGEKSKLSYAGAIKTEVRIARDAAAKELVLQFIVSPEPRLLNSGVVGKPVLQRVIDGQSQDLRIVLQEPKAAAKPMAEEEIVLEWSPEVHRVTEIRVKEGPAAARQVKELAGELTVQVELQNEVIVRLDKVLDAAGKSADGAGGGTLRLESLDRRANGHLELQITMNNLTPNPFGNNVIFNGNGGAIIRGNVGFKGGMIVGPNGVRINGGDQRDLPNLVDAKGEKFKVAAVLAESTNLNNGSISRSVRLVYQPNPNQAEPRELVLFGTRTHSIGVPFRFENVPLP